MTLTGRKMQFAAAVSRRTDTDEAVQEIIASLHRQLSGSIDLLTLFFTTEHQENAALMAFQLRQALNPRVLIGCGAEGIIGGDREIEREPGISAMAGSMPGVLLTPFQIDYVEWEYLLNAGLDENDSLTENVNQINLGRNVFNAECLKSDKLNDFNTDVFEAESPLYERLGINRDTLMGDQDATRAFLVLGDPYTTPISEFLQALDRVGGGAPTVGGMASGGQQPGENVLLLNDQTFDDGVVGVHIAGPIRVDTIVSQGCRPIGETLLVTQAEEQVINMLSGRPALSVAQDMLNKLSPSEQEQVQNGSLFLGIVTNEYQDAFERGDFLVRHVVGADLETGALVVGDTVRAGQTVQFHIQDAASADEDLRLMLLRSTSHDVAPLGGLIFSCNGRGLRMFDTSNHDVRAVLEAVPETPLAGFFAAGELGPVGGKSHIHGLTASIVLFRSSLEA